MTVEAVFFDLDETLVDDERCWRIAVTATCNEIAANHSPVEPAGLAYAYVENSERMWHRYGGVPRTASGLTSARDLRMEVWREVLAQCGLGRLGIEEDAVEAYERHRRANYACFTEVVGCLQRLQGQYRLAVITNGPGDGQREKLNVTGLAGFFDLVVASNDIGVGKPDARIFQHGLSSLGLDPARVWHIGDSLANDVAGALDAGLTAIWINRHGLERDGAQAEPHHEIASLSELPGLLP